MCDIDLMNISLEFRLCWIDSIWRNSSIIFIIIYFSMQMQPKSIKAKA